MSVRAGRRAILAAIGARIGVAVAKLVAGILSGSAAALAEGIHSLADTSTRVLLLLGGRRPERKGDAEHPLWSGRARDLRAFAVSIVLFTVGGAISLLLGYEKLESPEPLENWLLPMSVLVVSVAFEAVSLRTAVREFRSHRGARTRMTAPGSTAVLAQEIAALAGLLLALCGVALTAITGDGVVDAIATLLIGLVLVAVAIVLGIRMRGLLVGERASPEEVARIRTAINAHPLVEALIDMRTLHLGPDELLVAAKVALPSATKLAEVAAAIDAIETDVRRELPVARVIYLEPDIYTPPGEGHPSTDSIVIRSSD